MKFTDILALAKAGYKPADIQALMELAEPKSEPEHEPDPEPESEPESEPEAEHDEEGPTKDELLKEIENLKKEMNKANLSLKKAQEANRTKDNSNKEQKTDEEIFESFVNDFFN